MTETNYFPTTFSVLYCIVLYCVALYCMTSGTFDVVGCGSYKHKHAETENHIWENTWSIILLSHMIMMSIILLSHMIISSMMTSGRNAGRHGSTGGDAGESLRLPQRRSVSQARCKQDASNHMEDKKENRAYGRKEKDN